MQSSAQYPKTQWEYQQAWPPRPKSQTPSLKIKPINQALEKHITAGRLQICSMPIEGGDASVVYNGYAWTGSQTRDEERNKGDIMYYEVQLDAMERKQVPILIVGDKNAHVSSYRSLQRLISEFGWCDVGTCADRWGGAKYEATCKSSATAKPTIICYITANPQAAKYMRSFKIVFNIAIPTHARLELVLKGEGTENPLQARTKPQSLAERISTYIAKQTADIVDEKEKRVIENDVHLRLRNNMDQAFVYVNDRLNRLAGAWQSKALLKAVCNNGRGCICADFGTLSQGSEATKGTRQATNQTTEKGQRRGHTCGGRCLHR